MAFVLVSVCHVLSCQLSWLHPSCFCDYWLIYPTCVISLPSSFAPFIISLCLQSCVSLSLNVVCVMPCQSVSLPGYFFCLLFHFIINKALFPPAIESSLSSLPPSLTEYAWLKLMSHSLTRKSYYHTANSDSNSHSWYWFCEILDWFHNNTANTVFGETKSMLFQNASHLEIFTVVKQCGEKKNAI